MKIVTISLGKRHEELNLFEPKFELDNTIVDEVAVTSSVYKPVILSILTKDLVDFATDKDLVLRITEREENVGKEVEFALYSNLIEKYYTPKELKETLDSINKRKKS